MKRVLDHNNELKLHYFFDRFDAKEINTLLSGEMLRLMSETMEVGFDYHAHFHNYTDPARTDTNKINNPDFKMQHQK